MHDLAWLADQSSHLALGAWPLTLGLCLAAVVALGWSVAREPSTLRQKGGYLLLTAIPPVAIVLLGWRFEKIPSMAWSVSACLAGSALLTFGLVWRLARIRWLAASVGALGFWLSYSAAWIAGMAIADDWI